MKRTTIFLDPELEVILKLEVLRQKRPMAELVREAVHAYVTREPRRAPPGAGALASGVTDTAARAEAVHEETGSASCCRRGARGSPPWSVLLDTGIVYAYYDRSDDWHARARRVMEREVHGLVLPSPVVPEVDHLIGHRLGARGRSLFYEGIVGGYSLVADLPPEASARVAELDRQFDDLRLAWSTPRW